MSEANSNYFELLEEDSWVEYLRSRLPYSFKRISELRNPRRFHLEEPELVTGTFSAKYHNFWKRGHAYYMVGKLVDNHHLSALWEAVRKTETDQLWHEALGSSLRFLPVSGYDIYNAIQMATVWKSVQSNILDRERVAMANVSQAVELSLKAALTHANFRNGDGFVFNAWHSIPDLYECLPPPLRTEIDAEAKIFAESYVIFRQQLETKVKRLADLSFRTLVDASLRESFRSELSEIAECVSRSNYTAYVNANDPGSDNHALHENWFAESLDELRHVEWMDTGGYFRYAPSRDVDELPTTILNHVLLLGRFMHEHLFPMAPSYEG